MIKIENKLYLLENFIQNLNIALNAIAKVFRNNNIDFCFIGGCAVIAHNYIRTSDDIDILISVKDMDLFFKLFQENFFYKNPSNESMYLWSNPPYAFDVFYSGLRILNSGIRLEEPRNITEIINGIPFLSLYKLIEYKIATDRYKDFGDVEQLILVNNLSINFGDKFIQSIRESYIKIWYHVQALRKRN